MEMGHFARTVLTKRYAHTDSETWPEIAHRVATNVMGAVGASCDLVADVEQLIRERKFMPGGRYLAMAGRPYHQTQSCLMLRVEDSREGWGEHLQKSMVSLMTGAGIGCEYSRLRPEGAAIARTGGASSGPLALMRATNEVGRGSLQGGSRRAALWAGLNWQHPDIYKFIVQKNWSPEIRALKEKDFNFPAVMDFTNISVGIDDDFFCGLPGRVDDKRQQRAADVYSKTIRNMLETGEPGFSINLGRWRNEDLHNACTELCSEDDSDICNLGSINLARIGSLAEMDTAVELATMFLLAGTVYSDVPYQKVADVRAKNRRLGLGLMGIHEWLLQRGSRYQPNKELALYLTRYASSGHYAKMWASHWNLSVPVKTRAIAPTGTISIIAETTSGVEPIFCAAYRRRYFDRGTWRESVVLDPTAKRLIESGIDPDKVEDAYALAADIRRRLEFQAWLQGYVDHAVSSTINLPAWGTPWNCEDTVKSIGNAILEFLPRLRGLTVYPDGARGGQPLVPMSYREAVKEIDASVEAADVCDLRGGSCGS